MDKSVKYLLIALGIIAALVIVILAIKYFIGDSSTTPPAQSPGGPAPGPTDTVVDTLGNLLGDFVGGLFGKACDKNNPGFQKNGVYNPDKCGRPAELACDPNRPGWNIAGLPDVSC